MRKILTVIFAVGLFSSATFAQVKSSYLYNTSMPYGTLDIRTYISSTNYYYLQEGKTFAYRESSPGVRTYKYRDMTSWESSSYVQGNMRYKNGTSDKFAMNYRLLKPQNYNTAYSYPLIVILHGGVERGNCYYNECFHSDWNYDPNVNSPRAPTTVDHKLLNNDYQLVVGGKEHLDARNLAGTRLPNDPSMPSRAFPGFVLVCQMLNDWSVPAVQDMIRVVLLHTQKYKIDPNRIYLEGLSVGGYSVYHSIKRAPWLFAAAVPLSATGDANIFTERLESKVIHLGFWVFQGAKDTNPTPAYTRNLVTKLRNAGAIVKYSEYADLGHVIWSRVWAESSFYTWMLSRNNSNIHLYKGNSKIVRSTNTFPKLILPEGFFAYQWQKNGVTLSSTGNTLTVTSAGTYRARFSRVANPTSTQWNRWSNNVTITETTTASFDDAVVVQDPEGSTLGDIEVFPNPASSDNINISYDGDGEVRVKLVDALGRQVYDKNFNPAVESRLNINGKLNDGLYIIQIDNGEQQIQRRILIRN
jgi:hypothetical protein